MLGRANPETMDYKDDSSRSRRDVHLTQSTSKARWMVGTQAAGRQCCIHTFQVSEETPFEAAAI
jgi:hypothetical protein